MRGKRSEKRMQNLMRWCGRVTMALILILPFMRANDVQSQSYNEKAVADFYKGKTVTLTVGFDPGGGYDIATRIVAKHLARHIPGNPNTIVSNRPGGGSLVAANLVYGSLAQDGTHIVNFHPQMLLQQAQGREGIRFDGLKFHWLASLNAGSTSCAVHVETGINRLDQIKGPSGKVVKMGVEAPGSGITDGTAVIRAALGLNFRMIYGYTGQRPIVNAVLSREVDGICSSWDSFTSTLKNLFEPKQTVQMLVINEPELPKHPWLKSAVAAQPVAPDDTSRRLLRVVDGPRAISYPFAIGPQVPKDRVLAMQDAFGKMLKDQAFISDYEKTGRSYEPKAWKEVTEVVSELLTMDDKTKKALEEALKRREGP
jgi:tripartite-type tricarboxylate transporter receptor subunit TctC